MKHLLSTFVFVIVICISANGEEVSFSFKGTIHELDGEYSYFTGHPFEITYSSEDTTKDASPDDPEYGYYIGAIKSGTLTIFTDSEPSTWIVEPEGPGNIIEVKNLESADSYFAGVNLSGPDTGDKIPACFLVELIDRDATTLNNDALPSSFLISSFDYHCIVRFTFVGVKQYVYSTLGTISSGSAPVLRSDK